MLGIRDRAHENGIVALAKHGPRKHKEKKKHAGSAHTIGLSKEVHDEQMYA
ncbi:MAG: hypothetical protein PVS2B2_22920 [Candidatus Acidiferrum sp.]